MAIAVISIIVYLIQLGLGAYGYFKMQIRTVREQKLRRTVVIFAILPSPLLVFTPAPGISWLSVIVQLVTIAVYRFVSRYEGARDEELSARLKSSFSSDDSQPRQSGTRAPENPFDTGDDTARPSPTSGVNLLDPGVSDETATHTRPSDNPFG